VLVTLVLLPIGLYLIAIGDIPFYPDFAFPCHCLGNMRPSPRGRFRPAGWLMVAGGGAAGRARRPAPLAQRGSVRLGQPDPVSGRAAGDDGAFDRLRGAQASGTDFAVTVSGSSISA
jgi:hypothetical protein